MQYIPVNWSSPSVVFFRTDCDILYKSENLTSSEVNITLAEHYVGTENIHKEDSEGEHYQGCEGALSEVSFLFNQFFLFTSFVRDDIWCGAVGCVLCDQGERMIKKVQNYSFMKRRGLANWPGQDSHFKVNPQNLPSLFGAGHQHCAGAD